MRLKNENPLQSEKLPNQPPQEYKYTGSGNIYNIYDNKTRDYLFINENLPDSQLNMYPRFSVLQDYYKLYKNKAFQSHLQMTRMSTNQEDIQQLLVPNPSIDYLMKEFQKMKANPQKVEQINKSTITDAEIIIQQAQQEIDYQIQKQNNNVIGNITRNPYTNQYIPRYQRESVTIQNVEKAPYEERTSQTSSQLSVIQNQLKIIEERLKYRPNEQLINQMIEQTIQSNKVFCSLLQNGNVSVGNVAISPNHIQLTSPQTVQEVQENIDQSQQYNQTRDTISPPPQKNTIIQQTKLQDIQEEPQQLQREEENKTTIYIQQIQEQKEEQNAFLTGLTVHHPPTTTLQDPQTQIQQKQYSPSASSSQNRYQITDQQYKQYEDLSNSGNNQTSQREAVLAEKSMIDDDSPVKPINNQNNISNSHKNSYSDTHKQDSQVNEDHLQTQNVSSLFSKTGISLEDKKSPQLVSNHVPITTKQLQESLNSSISMDFSNLRHLPAHTKKQEPEKVNTSSHSIDIDEGSLISDKGSPKLEEKVEQQQHKVHKKRKQSKVPPKLPEQPIQRVPPRKKQKKKQPIVEYKDDSTLSLEMSMDGKKGHKGHKKQGIIQWDDSDDSDY